MLCVSEWFLLKRRILLSLSLWHIIIICALLALLTLSLVCFHCSVNFEKLWVKLSLVKEKETFWLFHFISLKQCSEINKMWVRVRVVWLRSHFPATMGQNMTPLLVWGSEMASWMLSVKCSEGSYSKHKLGLTVRFHISPYVNKSKSKPVREKLLSFGYICTEFPQELQLPSPKQKKAFLEEATWRAWQQHKYFLSELMHGLDLHSAEQVRNQMWSTELFSSRVGCSELSAQPSAALKQAQYADCVVRNEAQTAWPL